MLDNVAETNFKNESPTDFTVLRNIRLFEEALSSVKSLIEAKELEAHPIVAGKAEWGKTTIESQDPAIPTLALGKVNFADRTIADKALISLQSGAKGWADTPPKERAEIIRKIANLMREKRYFLTALIICECGKPWMEADGDVVEAIDFCDYYAAQMEKLGEPQKLVEVMGEHNIYFYQPRGVALVIGPWNFPLAIPCGMTVAALVTGNVTILKPAEQSSLIAFEFAKLVLEAGVPSDAFAFLPGDGEEIGAHLVQDRNIDLICFTGSKAVGLWIIEQASKRIDDQRTIKKVIAEMGGKNAIIIDEDADLDEAVKGVLYSAFGFAGQKCSACSRVIAVGDCYEPFLKRLCAGANDLIVGDPKRPETFLGPVIDVESQQRLLERIKKATEENSLAFQGEVPQEGYFVPATIFKDVAADSPIWSDELFGPVLACTRANSFTEAIELANNSEYALTGAVFSRSPNNLVLATKEFKVGNLYLNRGSTGAIVQRHPFGGFKMSGVGSKAGGPDYLLQFLEPRVVTENTMRRGFTPELL